MDEIKNTIQPVLDKLKELEPPPQEVMQEVPQQQENITVPQPTQTQDNNTTTASDSTSAPTVEAQTVDSGII